MITSLNYQINSNQKLHKKLSFDDVLDKLNIDWEERDELEEMVVELEKKFNLQKKIVSYKNKEINLFPILMSQYTVRIDQLVCFINDIKKELFNTPEYDYYEQHYVEGGVVSSRDVKYSNENIIDELKRKLSLANSLLREATKSECGEIVINSDLVL